MSYSLRAGSGRNCSVLILLASCQLTSMTYTIAVCTVKNSWRWTEVLSETCRVLFQKLISEISASSWFYYKKDDPLVFKYVATVRSITVSGVNRTYLFIYLLICQYLTKINFKLPLWNIHFFPQKLPACHSFSPYFTLVFEKCQERFCHK